MPSESTLRAWSSKIEIMPGFLSISFTQIKSYQKKSEKQNLLAEEEILINESNGELIDWKHIQNLHKLQECEGLRAANKLRKAHIAFQKQKMKVKLAVQVFSASVANSLLFAQHQEIPGFENCDGTINFILMIDQMFDYLNTRNCLDYENHFDKCIKTLKSLKRVNSFYEKHPGNGEGIINWGNPKNEVLFNI
ncbi:unnamed protein product [Gordionus sp. m RMFG-2023]